jgi:hypothetical protein
MSRLPFDVYRDLARAVLIQAERDLRRPEWTPLHQDAKKFLYSEDERIATWRELWQIIATGDD